MVQCKTDRVASYDEIIKEKIFKKRFKVYSHRQSRPANVILTLFFGRSMVVLSKYLKWSLKFNRISLSQSGESLRFLFFFFVANPFGSYQPTWILTLLVSVLPITLCVKIHNSEIHIHNSLTLNRFVDQHYNQHNRFFCPPFIVPSFLMSVIFHGICRFPSLVFGYIIKLKI